MKRPRILSIRFSLQFGVLAITCIAICLAIMSFRARRQAEVVRQLQELGFVVTYNDQGPDWMVQTFGIDYVRSVTGVRGYGMQTLDADLLRGMAALGTIERLEIAIANSDDAAFQAIGEIRSLRRLLLSTPPFPQEQFRRLDGLSNLEDLYVTQPIGDKGLSALCELKQLRKLSISSEGLSEEEVHRLACLPNLKFVKLRGNLDVSPWSDSVVVDDGSFRRNRNRRLDMLPVMLENNSSEALP